MTGYTRTPSVAATVGNLQRGHGATYEPTVPVKFAGLSAVQFEGQTAAAKHFFTPFSPPSHAASGSDPDQIEMDGVGDPFRFTVLNVRGKTVVVLVGSFVMSADQFAAFLPQADRLLASLRFPP